MDDNKEPFIKDTFIGALKELHIGEWRRHYTTKRFGYMVLDGTQWELEFEYSNGHKPVRFDGDNSYPWFRYIVENRKVVDMFPHMQALSGYVPSKTIMFK